MNGLAAMSRFRARMAGAVASNAHHDQRRAYLLDLLRDGYGIDTEEVELEAHVKVEEARGRIDVLFRRIVFEVKRDLERELDDVLRELHLYLTRVGERAFGIATDGAAMQSYRLSGGEVSLIDELDLMSTDDEIAFAWLDAYLFTQHSVRPTTDDVVRRFGPQSPVYLSAQEELQGLWARVRSKSETIVKQEEWDRLLRVVYGTTVASDDLFIRHTYLAAVARLFAFLAIARRAPSVGEEAAIMSGPAFERLGIENLVEEDFFVWVLDDDIASESEPLLRGIARHLGIYATELIDEDLLKHLYETLVDPVERHDLGEYYTPDWLADLLLREAGFDVGVRTLDPACGSGTFLFMAIRLLRDRGLEGAELVEAAQANLIGFDVHPLAVAIARANFVLALRDDALKSRTAITVPIWMANALVAPTGEFGRPIRVDVPRGSGNGDESFRLPTDMEDAVPGSLTAAVDDVIRFARTESEDEDAAAGFERRLRELGVGEFAELWIENLLLFRQLLRERRDTVWAFELSNAVRPQVVARNPVDLVVGNPPWLPVRMIARSEYQDRVTELALDYNLLTERRGWQTGALELATVFACFCIDHYLRDDGLLAFVLPRGVLFGAKQHDTFRRLALNVHFTPERAFDLRGVDPLFRVPACAIIVRKEKRRT